MPIPYSTQIEKRLKKLTCRYSRFGSLRYTLKRYVLGEAAVNNQQGPKSIHLRKSRKQYTEESLYGYRPSIDVQKT